ncbi:MAG: ribose-phosphate pyrophosphokinase [Nitrosomonadaceae bacterium]|nr:ribose-phosphate pyrophosphokinase [Nitrosomonadaceae bacterium]
MVVLSGNGNKPLAREIALRVNGGEPSKAIVDTFPDGETKVQIDSNVRGGDVFIIQPTCPPTNNNLMELLLMIDACRRASADRITAVIPFYGYSRQDRKDQPRVPISAKLVANMLVAAGADRILTMDLHAPQIQGFFDIPVDHLYSLPVAHRGVSTRPGAQLVVVSPDLGGMKRASAFAKAFNADLAIVSKSRVDASTTTADYIVGNVKGCYALLVDDMTETGGTLVNAAKLLKEHGAVGVSAFVTHALIDNDLARARLRDAFRVGDLDFLYTTDTVPLDLEAARNVYFNFPTGGPRVVPFTVAGLFAEAIRRIHNKESVTQLFELGR